MKISKHATIKIILSLFFAITSSQMFGATLPINNYSITKTAQDTFKIQGTIRDAKSGETIPFCNITLNNSFTGTSSNELGEFEIDVKKLPTILVFTHINYETFSIEIKNKKPLSINLAPLVNVLDEVKLKPTDVKDDYAINLVKKAFYRINDLSNVKKYGKA